MAPVKSKGSSSKTSNKSSTPGKRLARKSTSSSSSRSKSGKTGPKFAKQIKTKPGSQQPTPSASARKKKPVYTDKQLALPTLNGIVPATASAPNKAGGTGKKKGKVYIDDAESMLTILAVVSAEKEGAIESKVLKERRLEEVREARRKEAEAKEAKGKKGAKNEKVEEVKEDLRRAKREKRDRKGQEAVVEGEDKKRRRSDGEAKAGGDKGKRKRVSFA